jgi:hypothetical protein
MLSFSGSLQIFVALEPCDLRKSFEGLYALVSERLGEDPGRERSFYSATVRIPASKSFTGMELACGYS